MAVVQAVERVALEGMAVLREEMEREEGQAEGRVERWERAGERTAAPREEEVQLAAGAVRAVLAARGDGAGVMPGGSGGG